MVRESAIQNERELGAIAMEMPMRDAFGSSLIKLLDSVFSGLRGCERSGGSVASIINLATHDSHDYIMRGTTIHNAGPRALPLARRMAESILRTACICAPLLSAKSSPVWP